MRFATDDKHLIKLMWVEKNYVEKRLLKVFLTEDEVLVGYKDTDQNISARSLTSLIFAVGWALCGRPQPDHESVMPLLSLSPLNVLTH